MCVGEHGRQATPLRTDQVERRSRHWFYNLWIGRLPIKPCEYGVQRPLRFHHQRSRHHLQNE